MKTLACGMALTLFLQFIHSKIGLFIISDQLCLSALTLCTVSVKSHISKSLMMNPHADNQGLIDFLNQACRPVAGAPGFL